MPTLTIDDTFAATAGRPSRVWRRAAVAAGVAGLLALGWQVARPFVAEAMAQALAPALAQQLGPAMLHELERGALAPSALPDAQQRRIALALAGLQAPHEGAPAHRVLFRSMPAGGTAFALPSGDIVVSDALVQALPDDGAVLAVLAHELGHLQHRHWQRSAAQEALLPTAVALVSGNTSWLAARMAALAPTLPHSGLAEIEADNYAANLLQLNGLALRSLEEAPTALAQQQAGIYLAQHPLDAERVARLRERRND